MIAVLLFLIAQGADGEPDNLLWPVGDGWEAPEVYTTYGQAVDEGPPLVHRGLDIVPPKDWRRVYAIESGVVVEVSEDGGEAGVLIERTSALAHGKKRAFWYLHLDPKKIRVKKGQRVSENQWLGSIPTDDGLGRKEHLHLSRLEGDYRNQGWSELDALAVRNPLALIDAQHHEDTEAPRVHAIDAGHFGFLRHDTEVKLDPEALEAGAIDVVARVDDRSDHSRELAPRSMRLVVKGAGAADEFVLELDSPLPLAGIYSEDPPFESHGAHDEKAPIEPPTYYFFLTGSAGWLAAPGHYTLELFVADATGNERPPISQTVHVD